MLQAAVCQIATDDYQPSRVNRVVFTDLLATTRTIMDFYSAKDFTGQAAWDALDLQEFDEPTTVRLHWTDAPYVWHVNDGEEVFTVLDGEVDMHYRAAGCDRVVRMRAGDICRAGSGDEHVAHPRGQARVLVVETTGSI